jgi:Tol biopolymer transport system component
LLGALLVVAAVPAAVAHAAGGGTTERVSVSSTGAQANAPSYSPSISADGRYVAFVSFASNLVPGSNTSDNVIVHDRQTGSTSLVSVSSTGAQPNSASHDPSMSADGRYVAFDSVASNLVPGDANGNEDVFVRDQQTGTTSLVSLSSTGAQANSGAYEPAISGDGRYVVFTSYASNLVPSDTNATADVFVRDRQTGTTSRVSVSSTGAQGNLQSFSGAAAISADGRYVAFESFASNLVPGDTNGREDVFVRDRQTGTTTLVSVSSTGVQGNAASLIPSISADGQHVVFESKASNLVSGDADGCRDVFVHDLLTRITSLVSVSSTGTQGDHASLDASISADGRYVAFDSTSPNLVAGDTNYKEDVFVRDRQTGITRRVSLSNAGSQGNQGGAFPSISADGQQVAFDSFSSNLVPGDTNGTWDAFVRDSGAGL